MNEQYEARVAQLKKEGLTAVEARKMALAEQRVLKQAEAAQNRQAVKQQRVLDQMAVNEAQSKVRQSQANARLGFSIIRIILSMFKGSSRRR